MNKTLYHLEHHNTIPKEYEEVLYHGISEGDFQAKDCLLFVPLAFLLKIRKNKYLEELLASYFMDLSLCGFALGRQNFAQSGMENKAHAGS